MLDPQRGSLAGVVMGSVALVVLTALLTAVFLVAGVGTAGALVVATLLSGTGAWLAARRLSATFDRRIAALQGELETRSAHAEAREKFLRVLVDATPLALLFYGEAGRIRFANSEARRLFFEGRSPEGENFLGILAHAPEGLRHALLGGADELFTVDIDGQRETYHFSRRTFPFDGEAHTLLLARQLTFEVSRREVEVLRKVIRIISHELNNSLAPVASLVHSARLIANNPAHTGTLVRVFDTIEERTSHLTSFLNGYATLARLPKPRQSVVEWDPLLQRLRSLFPAAQIAATGGASAWCDAGQVEQLLINLLKNATEAGGQASSVELSVTPDADQAVTLQVSDRGKGLTSEALESAFLPLYSTKEKGSGMGLTLCREIAEAHAGRMSIRNREGGGCTVTCWLPGPRKQGAETAASRATLTLTRS